MPFVETFDVTIHDRNDVSNIEKFIYLKGFVSGSALQSIEGMPLTNDNYNIVKDMLDKRYGLPQMIVSRHMNALIKLGKTITAIVNEH